MFASRLLIASSSKQSTEYFFVVFCRFVNFKILFYFGYDFNFSIPFIGFINDQIPFVSLSLWCFWAVRRWCRVGEFQGRRNQGVGADITLDFGRSVNPIPSKVAYFAPPPLPLGVSDLPTSFTLERDATMTLLQRWFRPFSKVINFVGRFRGRFECTNCKFVFVLVVSNDGHFYLYWFLTYV